MTRLVGVMLESRELNITEVKRRARLSHDAASRHLEFLAKEGLVTEKRFNRIRVFSLEQTNPLVVTLTRFFSEWKALAEPGEGEVLA